MKAELYDGSRKTAVDTRHDECLYAAPRPARDRTGLRRQGKDLFLHMDKEKKAMYYLYLWSTSRSIHEKIIPVSPIMAERFLRAKGLACNLFPKSDPVAALYAWGYGIAEEF